MPRNRTSDSSPISDPSVPKVRRVTYLTTELELGGAEKNLLALADRVRKYGFQPRVIGLKSPGRLAERLEQKGIPWTSMHMSYPPHPESLFELISLLEEQQTDVLQTFLFHANIFGRIAGSLAGVPVILSSVRVCEKKRSSHLLWDGFTIPLVDREVCVSRSVEAFMSRRAGISERKLVTIPNAVHISPESISSTTDEELFASYDIPAGNPLIVSAGRLTEQKGHDLLLRAVDRLQTRFPDLRCVVFGEGEMKSTLEDERDRKNLSEHFFLPGWCEHLPDMMSAADLFVLSSRWEGMPNVLLEAGALNLPIVATKTGGVPDLFPESYRTFPRLVKPESAGAIADGAASVLQNLQEHQSRARRIGQHIRNRFTVKNMVTSYVELYQTLLQEEGVA